MILEQLDSITLGQARDILRNGADNFLLSRNTTYFQVGLKLVELSKYFDKLANENSQS